MSKNDTVITRIFDAPPEKVWKAWTTPEIVKKWWGPKDFTAPYICIDLKKGGRFVFAMHGSTAPGTPAKDFWTAGNYVEIDPPKKIVALKSFADEEGDPVPASKLGMPGNWPMATHWTVTFEDAVGGRTKLTMKDEGIPPEMAESSRMGWQQSLDKFAESLRS